MGIPGFDEYLATYCERAGLAVPANVGFYRAYNLFRIAAIKQGIVGRLRAGTVVSENAAEFEKQVRPLAQAAWREVEEL
jgi:aminoglycoside phosphotransferase (APT) family kinase protein